MNVRRALPLPLLLLKIECSYWIRVFPLEIRSLVGRILALRDKRKGREEVFPCYLFADDAPGPSKLSLETIGRSSSIQILNSKYPWASDGDYLMVLQGWSLGVLFAHYTLGSEGKDTARALAEASFFQEYEALCGRVLDGLRKSMPEVLPAPQSPIHGAKAQIPSQE